ncbi:MAG: hypothetical protein ABIO86_01875 [Sphingomonas sp.]
MTGRDQLSVKGGCAEAPQLPLRARRLAIALAMLLAILWQSFVTQTHIHANPDIYATAISDSAGAPVRLKAGEAPSDLPATCPICREVAHAGSYLSPTAVALQPPVPVDLWRAATPTPSPTRRQRSHAWQSRAPPYQLQA